MSDVMSDVRRALGRREPLGAAPVPPVIDESVVRLVHAEIGLSELLVAQAGKSAMGAELVRPEELAEKLIAFLQSSGCKKIALPVSPLLEALGLIDALNHAGFELLHWDQSTADAVYDCDCGVTDVYAAVAETGSIVVRASVEHGRLLSLVPPIHVAIVEPRLIVPDLVDLMEKISREPVHAGVTLITGPSKTSDIEGNLVTGVHGPEIVRLFVLN